MSKDLSKKTLGIIHATHISIAPASKYAQEFIPEVEVMHLCDDTIQRDNLACPVGTIPKHNFAKFAQYAHNLEEAGCDMILLACSTFNRAAELAAPMINIPILQIDRTMMELAVSCGNRVGMLATLPTTIPASERLLYKAAEDAGKEITVKTVLLSEAFQELLKGNVDKHNEMLIKAVNELSEEVDSIVLAQLSMSALAPLLTDTKVPVFNSGATAFPRIRQMLEQMD